MERGRAHIAVLDNVVLSLLYLLSRLLHRFLGSILLRSKDLPSEQSSAEANGGRNQNDARGGRRKSSLRRR